MHVEDLWEEYEKELVGLGIETEDMFMIDHVSVKILAALAEIQRKITSDPVQ